MSLIVKVVTTPVTPYAWPMDSYPGFVNQTGDFYSNEAQGDPSIINVTIPSVWSSSTVNYNMTFEGVDETTVVTDVTLVSAPPQEANLIITRVNNTTYNVTGSVSPATGEFFNFLLPNKTYANLPPTTTEDWIAVVRWNPATKPWERQYIFTFDVAYSYVQDSMPMVATETIAITQYAYWHWEPSLNMLKQLAIDGEL